MRHGSLLIAVQNETQQQILHVSDCNASQQYNPLEWPDNTAGEAATDIVIDSYPSALNFPSAPFDIFNEAGFTISDNSFTVAGGVVTAAEFREQNGSHNAGFEINFLSTESELVGTKARSQPDTRVHGS
jgi:hypothetical protein